MSAEEILTVEDLIVHYPGNAGPVRAVEGVSLTLRRGETLGLVGESGCGKSTLARAIVGLVRPTSGSIRFHGEELRGQKGERLRRRRSRLQMVFQDPYASLNPRMTLSAIVAEPIRIHHRARGGEVAKRVEELLGLVGLDPSLARRYPHELSGGQRQRVGLARALALEPEVLLLDEPVSALDVSVQAQVLNLLESLRERLGLTYLFIAHHLAVVHHMSDRVAVMYMGRIVEEADRDALYREPLHPYTEALLSAVPELDPARSGRDRIVLAGEVGQLAADEGGCPFRNRCPRAADRCARERPRLLEERAAHRVACHFPGETA